MLLPLETDAIITRRVWPAQVNLGPVMYRAALVIVTERQVYVWTRRDMIVVSDRWLSGSTLPPAHLLAAQPMTVLTESSGTVVVNLDGGCGCGSDLRGFQPFTPEVVAG